MAMDAVNAESTTRVPNALLDTNVLLAAYSWHDFIDGANRLLERDPTATLEHDEIQFRAQRARAAFLLTLFLNQNEWKTLAPAKELERILVARAPPTDPGHGVESDFVRLYLSFVCDRLLPGWELWGDDLNSDAAFKGSGVDRHLLDLAERYEIPFLSWEGHGPNGLDASKLVPREAHERGIDLLTPEELLRRQNFDEGPAIQRFFLDWDEHVAAYLLDRPDAKEILEVARPYFQRLAYNDWTP